MIGMQRGKKIKSFHASWSEQPKFRGSYLALLEKAVNSTYGDVNFLGHLRSWEDVVGVLSREVQGFVKNTVAEISDSVRLRINLMYFNAHGMIDFYEFGMLQFY